MAKAERLIQKYPELMKLIFEMNEPRSEDKRFDIGLVQKLYYWITKLIKEEYLNQLFLERAFKRICTKCDLPAI